MFAIGVAIRRKPYVATKRPSSVMVTPSLSWPHAERQPERSELAVDGIAIELRHRRDATHVEDSEEMRRELPSGAHDVLRGDRNLIGCAGQRRVTR